MFEDSSGDGRKRTTRGRRGGREAQMTATLASIEDQIAASEL